ncbi:hypothetical protein SDC9_170843 [bioreactor metagenome]|uniref:Uncharacterized protein n=1 Tax=bioreactor metagenome TaxID=1076179 RepID=A0A645G9Y2_9ZZZZ
MEFSNVAHKRGCRLVSPESAFAVQVETTRIVVAYISRSRIKQGIPDILGMRFGNKGDQFKQGVFSRTQHPELLQTKHLCKFKVHSLPGIIEVSMRSINHNIVFDSLYHTPFNISAPHQRFKRFKGQRMMRDYKVASQ